MLGIQLKHDGWVVVADGEKALFLRNEGDAFNPNLEVFREMEQDNPPSRDQGSDRPGRMPDGSGGQHRSAVADTDWQQLGKERFAKDIAARLYKYAHAGKFERLVVIAPPSVLGDMRKEFHPVVADKIIGEIPKTFTNHPIDKIESLLLN